MPRWGRREKRGWFPLVASRGKRLQSGMKLIGLTGGVGMGKSTAANLLRELGLPLVDTDDLAREVVAPGEPALDEIHKTFGDVVMDACLLYTSPSPRDRG